MEKEEPKIPKKYDFAPCPKHMYTNVIYDKDTGEHVCGSCGLVLQERYMDRGPEWRAFTDEEKESRPRVGLPITYAVYDKGLSTSIIMGRDAFGKPLKEGTRQQVYRMIKHHQRSRVHTSVERNLAQAMAELDRLADNTYIKKHVKEKAAIIYRKALDKGITRGRSINAIVDASLLMACKQTGTLRTDREIAEAGFVDRKDLNRAYRLLQKELDIKPTVTDPILYVSKLAEKVGISGKTQGTAIEILRQYREAHKGNISGKDRQGLAGAALYIGCLQNNEKKTQQKIAEAAGVTEVTVRNRYESIKEELKLKSIKITNQ